MEYCGWICKKCENGKPIYEYTPPEKGSYRECRAETTCKEVFGDDWEEVGIYHSHPRGGELSGVDRDTAQKNKKPVWMAREKKGGHRGARQAETWRTTGDKKSDIKIK